MFQQRSSCYYTYDYNCITIYGKGANRNGNQGKHKELFVHVFLVNTHVSKAILQAYMKHEGKRVLPDPDPIFNESGGAQTLLMGKNRYLLPHE